MAAYAALVSLMNNIEQIQRHTRLPICFDQKQSESLLEKVNFLIDFLESHNYRAADEEMKVLESRIRDAAYAAEDIIETHVVDSIHAHSKEKNEIASLPVKPDITDSHSRSRKGKNRRSGKQFKKTVPTISAKNQTLSCIPGIEKVLEEMDFIEVEAMKRKGESAIEDMQPRSPITTTFSSRSTPDGKNSMVGFDDHLLELMELLAGHQSRRQIIPVVGMGGIGKTTLAKTAYDKPFIVEHFHFRAWVSISQDYDFKRIVLGILPNESSQMSDTELAQRLHKKLCRTRYLVVLDDMWSVEAWNMVKLFLPDNKNGSRIIVTTRDSNVATHLDKFSLKMNFLNKDESWNLFCEKVFVQESCPLEFEEVGRKIVKNCKGLPLSIIVIGGLLAKSEMRKDYWEYIAANTKEIISSDNNGQCMKILSLSYQSLPVQLKPCFLYFGAFPEDEKIHVSMLIKLWVAEGFLKSNSSKELEVLGREFLNDLVSRNLVMVVERGPLNGKIKFCMIHDLLRDICLQGAMFAQIVLRNPYVEQVIGTQRHISIHKRVSYEWDHRQFVDTLDSGSMSRTLIMCGDRYEVSPLQNLRLTRVLKYSNSEHYSVEKILELVNSRLIRIETNSYLTLSSKIPSTLRLLWNLQILIVIASTDPAPLEIWEMTELRHVEFRLGIYLPDPPPSQQRSKHEGDATMKKLHTLKGIVNFRLSDEVVKRIPNIKKLKIYYNLNGIPNIEELLKGLKYLRLLKNLESLNLEFIQYGSNLLSYLTFPNSLKKLSLERCGLQWEDMSMISSLPHLEVLILKHDAFRGRKWVLDEEVFHSLKYFLLSDCELVHWIAEDTNFPCLEHLELTRLDKLVEIPSGIGDIPTLQKFKLIRCRKSAVNSAKIILMEQEELGNVAFKLSIIRGD